MEKNRPAALVTGASRGIGAGIARSLAVCGYDLLINYVRNAEAAEGVAEEVESLGGRAFPVQGDVSRREDRERILRESVEKTGKIDLLVNNAGIASKERLDILEATEEGFEEILGTNLKGPYFLTQSIAKEMLKWRLEGRVNTPRIVFITSVSAYVASKNRGDYYISKAGLSMAAQIFAVRLAADQIPVFEIRPGLIDTDMTAAVKEKYTRLIEGGRVPQGRWGSPQDVGQAVVAIAKGAFDFSTGQVFEVGGGFLLREL